MSVKKLAEKFGVTFVDQPESSPLFAWVDPRTAAENPLQWKQHSEDKLDTLGSFVEEVGWLAAGLINLRTEENGWPADKVGAYYVDGHGRRQMCLDRGLTAMPVLVGSWTPDQESQALAFLDEFKSVGVTVLQDKFKALMDGVRPASGSGFAAMKAKMNLRYTVPGNGGQVTKVTNQGGLEMIGAGVADQTEAKKSNFDKMADEGANGKARGTMRSLVFGTDIMVMLPIEMYDQVSAYLTKTTEKERFESRADAMRALLEWGLEHAIVEFGLDFDEAPGED